MVPFLIPSLRQEPDPSSYISNCVADCLVADAVRMGTSTVLNTGDREKPGVFLFSLVSAMVEADATQFQLPLPNGSLWK